MRKIAIVIPAHNEESSILNVLRRIPRLHGFESRIFVVDDGSDDGTFRVTRENGGEVARHPVSLGVGGALKTGYLLAKEWNADIIVQLDADGEHCPMDLPKLLEPIVNEDIDVVVGSRFINGDPPISFVRKIGIIFFTWLVNRLTGYKLTDITSGYRIFKSEILDKIIFPSEKHWAIEMTLLAGRNGLKLKELPIKALTRKVGESQFYELMTFVLYPIRVVKQIIEIYL